jgi:hypothetical protein
MPDEPSTNDPKTIWQSQPKEVTKMSLDKIRREARAIQTKSRMAALGWSLLGLVVTLGFALLFLKAQGPLHKAGWGALALWGLYGVYQACKRMWPSTLAADATFANSLGFYRRELERRRDYVRDIWRMQVLWVFFVGLALFIAPALIGSRKNPRVLLNAIPFFVLLGVWFIALFYIRNRDQKELQREIDELIAL